MKAIIVILSIFTISCSKQSENIERQSHCELCIELSDKYLQADSSFIRTDTLYYGRLCDSTLNRFKMEAEAMTKTFTLCGTGLLEKRYFIYKN